MVVSPLIILGWCLILLLVWIDTKAFLHGFPKVIVYSIFIITIVIIFAGYTIGKEAIEKGERRDAKAEFDAQLQDCLMVLEKQGMHEEKVRFAAAAAKMRHLIIE